MKRSGFTMIELIFVIVILGILAAVAVPKLAATRDDAKIAKGATELATAVSDIGAYYTSKGALAAAGTMSNVFSGITTDLNNTANSVTMPGDANCITINAEGTGGAGGGADTINVQYTHAGATSVCTGIAKAAYSMFGQSKSWTPSADVNLSHKFGGTAVVW